MHRLWQENARNRDTSQWRQKHERHAEHRRPKAGTTAGLSEALSLSFLAVFQHHLSSDSIFKSPHHEPLSILLLSHRMIFQELFPSIIKTFSFTLRGDTPTVAHCHPHDHPRFSRTFQRSMCCNETSDFACSNLKRVSQGPAYGTHCRM